MKRPPLSAVAAFALTAYVFVAIFQAGLADPIQGDGHYTWMHGHSLLMDGDLDLRNDYEICGDPWGLGAWRSGDRWPHNTWNVGPAYVWVPFGLYGRLVHGDLPEGNGRGCENAVSHTAVFGSVVAGILVWLFAYLLARRHVGVGPAVVGATAMALGSSLPYYASVLPSYGHAPAAFATVLFLERWDATRGREDLFRWGLIGGLLGFAMLMRTQCALFAIAPLFEWLAMARRAQLDGDRARLRKLVGRGLLFVLMAVMVFLPQMMVWQHTFGVPFAMPQGSHYMRWGHMNVDGVLFAQVNGLVTWTPLTLPGIVGLGIAAVRRETRAVGIPLAVLLLAFILVNAAVWDYWGMSGYSNRRFTELTGLLAVGCAFAAHSLFRLAVRRPRFFAGATLMAVVGACGLWNVASIGVVASAKVNSAEAHRAPTAWQEIYGVLSEGVWERVGNPLAWPASVPWALLHDAHPKQYDVMRGKVIFFEEYNSRRVRPGFDQDRAELGEGIGPLYLADGFEAEPREVASRSTAVTNASRSRVIVPLFADDVAGIEITWTLAPPVDDPSAVDAGVADPDGDAEEGERLVWSTPIVVSVNGETLAHHVVTRSWVTTRIELQPDVVDVGENEFVFETDGTPVAVKSIRFLQMLPRSSIRRRKGG